MTEPGRPWLVPRFHNSLTRRTETLETVEPGTVAMYHCGPTVYSRPTLGNWRSFLLADLLRRTLEWGGWRVRQVMNLTDVGHFQDDDEDAEDRMEAEAAARGESPWAMAERVIGWFFEDMDWIGMRRPHVTPRATDYIPQMVDLVSRLIERGYAYRVGENVYFAVEKWPGYGRLSGNRVEDLEAGARLAVNEEKRHPADFALWKSDERHVMQWDTQFGPHGFPGWHVECSAMAMDTLGETIDIHTGGEDNAFPHHECELAQSEAATGRPFARYWLHARFLQIDGGRMGKSLGNAFTPEDVRERGYSPQALRLALQRGHYRQPLNFTWEEMDAAASQVERLGRFAEQMESAVSGPDAGVGETEPFRSAYAAAMADDLDVPRAWAAVMEAVRALRAAGASGAGAREALAFVAEVDETLGVLPVRAEEADEEVEALVAAREEARARGDWAEADRLRDELAAEGVALEDTPEGPKWRRRARR